MAEGRQPLPDIVERLLLDRIDSIAQLELLLALHRSAPAAWSAAEIGGELRIDPAWAAEQLAVLCDRELAGEAPPGSRRYCFEPATEALAKAADALAACYADRRVAVVALLYARPGPSIRALADAFRIRKEDGDG